MPSRPDPIRSTWDSMKQRCYNPKSTRWQWYGARGITVCRRWRNSLEAFRQDMGPRPPGCCLDRKNNDRNYTPGNCRWATIKQSANNKQNTRWLKYKGRTQSIDDWPAETGITYHVLTQRIHRLKWSVRKALTTPVRQVDVLIEFRGRSKTLAQWAKVLKVSYISLWSRMRLGWSIERVLSTPLRGTSQYCGRGHRWIQSNTYVQPGNGKRVCRKCKYLKYLRRRERLRMENVDA